MRFAGQRFRSSRGSVGNYRAASGYVGDFNGRVGVPGIEPAMVAMPEKNARNMAFTEMPVVGKSPVSAGNFGEPEFQAPRRA